MDRYRFGALALMLVTIQLGYTACATAAPPALTLQPEDRIVFLGNTFAERLRHFNYLEAQITAALPDYHLTFRNLGWSADEVDLQPRPMNFGDYNHHLHAQEADVVLLCFGINESFQGDTGLEAFAAKLGDLIDDLHAHEYNGASPPRLALVTPTPQEQVATLPDMRARNAEIASYVAAMRGVAEEKQVALIDLFTPMAALLEENGGPDLTFNGIHYAAYGYWAAAQAIMTQLDIAPPPTVIEGDVREGIADAPGIQVLESSDSVLRLLVEAQALSVPAPPGDQVHDTLRKQQPTLRITGLPDGTYTLRIGGQPVLTCDAAALAAGVHYIVPADQAKWNVLLENLAEKNLLFFDRWRAVNGFYIYGGRKEPFGVVSFPPEMDAFDALVAAHESEVQQMQLAPDAYELTIEAAQR